METTHETLARIVTANPKAADVFARYGLDFCCHGQRPLDEACVEAGHDARTVLAELSSLGAEGSAEESWGARPLAELIDHILTRYHARLRRDLPTLIALARKVEEVHAAKANRPVGLAEHLERIAAAVESHLAKEERILFPLIRAGRGATAYMPIKVMMQEHEDHGDNLRRTRALTNDLVAPAEACASWSELYRGLAELEADLWKHIHLENNVLFPLALGTFAASQR